MCTRISGEARACEFAGMRVSKCARVLGTCVCVRVCGFCECMHACIFMCSILDPTPNCTSCLKLKIKCYILLMEVSEL